MEIRIATPKDLNEIQELKEMLTQRDLARILKVSKQTIFNYRKRFGLPYHVVGNIVRFSPDEVMEWWKRQTSNRFKEESK